MARLHTPTDILDDSSIATHRLLYAAYYKWMLWCGFVVGIFAFVGVCFFLVLSATLFWEWQTLDGRFSRADFLFLYFCSGSLLCCLLLLWGVAKALAYAKALRAASLGAPVEDWLQTSPQGYRLWKVGAWATLILVLSWGPALLYQYRTATAHIPQDMPVVPQQAAPVEVPFGE